MQPVDSCHDTGLHSLLLWKHTNCQDGDELSKEHLPFAGMKCGGCVSHVKRLLEEQPGVAGASVNLATETALVRVRLSDAGADSKSEAAVNVAKQLAQVRISM